ncbi:TPA: type II toxin-antitoxin system VapC family toxin [Salmonella enterica]
MNKTYMLDTCICSFIMREQPEAVLKRLEQAVLRNHRIVVSAVTYAEMRFGATGPKASPRHIQLVDAFCERLDAIVPWDRSAVDATTDVKLALRLDGTPIGPNDTAIAGHAIAAGAVLVTNNTREFERVPGLVLEDWGIDTPLPKGRGFLAPFSTQIHSETSHGAG